VAQIATRHAPRAAQRISSRRIRIGRAILRDVHLPEFVVSVLPIIESFEIAAERAGDVAPAIYAAYFARCPESRELMRYVDQYMRGRMLESLYELLMADETSDQLRYLRFEAANHSTYGVLPHMYENLLTAVRETVRHACGDDWTSAMASAWDARLGVLLREIATSLAPVDRSA
jgi:Globin